MGHATHAYDVFEKEHNITPSLLTASYVTKFTGTCWIKALYANNKHATVDTTISIQDLQGTPIEAVSGHNVPAQGSLPLVFDPPLYCPGGFQAMAGAVSSINLSAVVVTR